MMHLDDELLSAHLDGENLPDGGAGHLATCDQCRDRLEAFRAVAEAVGSPGPPAADAAREAAVAAALAAMDAVPVTRPLPDRRPAPVIPLHRRVATAAAPWLAMAAVLVAVVVGVSMLSTNDGGDDEAAFQATEGRVGDSGGAAVIDGGDVGEYSDGNELQRVVQERLQGAERSTAMAAEEGAGEEGASDDGGAGGGAQPEADVGSDQGVATDLAARCEGSLRGGDPRLGELAYVATLRWQDTPAVLLVFRLTPEPGDAGDEGRFTTSVYVVDPESACSVLLQQAF